MAHEEEKLPWDLMEEILSRVPPKSLVRFRAVSKPWNNLFNDKRFIPQPQDDVSLRPSNQIQDLFGKPKELIDCNEFLLFRVKEGASVWNPWLRQSRWIENCSNQYLSISGIGYDNYRSYKILGCCTPSLWKIYASYAWKDHQIGGSNTDGEQKYDILMDPKVSLNGTLYRVAYPDDNEDSLFITGFDFSKEKFFDFCYLPCGKNHPNDALVLGIFKGEQFSLLKQCYATKKIEIFVTKDKITTSNRDDVVWMSFMQVSIPNFPDLVRPSYFIDNDKRLIVCSCDETDRAWIYVVWENKLISKLQLDSVVGHKPLHCTYNPSLVMVPSIQREEV